MDVGILKGTSTQVRNGPRDLWSWVYTSSQVYKFACSIRDPVLGVHFHSLGKILPFLVPFMLSQEGLQCGVSSSWAARCRLACPPAPLPSSASPAPSQYKNTVQTSSLPADNVIKEIFRKLRGMKNGYHELQGPE